MPGYTPAFFGGKRMLDLHMHSIYSEDGDIYPAGLVEQCHAAGVDFMSVTDHNSMRGTEAAAAAAGAAGIGFINGVELDCVYKGLNFHVLGYGMDDSRGDFTALDAEMERKYRSVGMEYLEKTRALGFEVTPQELREVAGWSIFPERWTGERFGAVLLDKAEYANDPRLAPYRPGGARSDNPCINFYWDYFAQGKPCYVEMEFMPMARALEMIYDNGGVAVLAHPGNNLKGHEELFDEIMALGFKGVEAFSSYHTLEQTQYYYQLARKSGKFMTIGSDYHGRLKPAISLGRVAFPKGIDRVEVEAEARRNLEKYLR